MVCVSRRAVAIYPRCAREQEHGATSREFAKPPLMLESEVKCEMPSSPVFKATVTTRNRGRMPFDLDRRSLQAHQLARALCGTKTKCATQTRKQPHYMTQFVKPRIHHLSWRTQVPMNRNAPQNPSMCEPAKKTQETTTRTQPPDRQHAWPLPANTANAHNNENGWRTRHWKNGDVHKKMQKKHFPDKCSAGDLVTYTAHFALHTENCPVIERSRAKFKNNLWWQSTSTEART